MGIFDFTREVTYEGCEYFIIEQLDGGLLLVVDKTEMKNSEFPLQTKVIPAN